MNKFHAAFFLAAGFTLGPARIVVAASLVDQLRTCAAESDSARRLNCYDRLSASLRTAVDSRPGSQDSTAVATPATTVDTSEKHNVPAEKAEFGIRNGPLDARQQPARQQSETAVVTKVTVMPYGQLLVTLDNGQLWKQNEAAAYFPLKSGDTVQISIGALGSYVLSAPSKRATKVTRVN